MNKTRLSAFLFALVMALSLAPVAFAASDEAIDAANKLHDLGLFSGVGTNADGSINYDLDRTMTRAEAVTMLVRLLGKENEAKTETWQTPFTDIVEWAKPYVGYAYAHGLTGGTSATTFSGADNVSAAQYLTFVLRALGYDSNTDFQWDKAWELTDGLGITKGQYGADKEFQRGDAAVVSYNALNTNIKSSDNKLLQSLDTSNTTASVLSDAAIQGVWHGNFSWNSLGQAGEMEYIFENGTFSWVRYETQNDKGVIGATLWAGNYSLDGNNIELSVTKDYMAPLDGSSYGENDNPLTTAIIIKDFTGNSFFSESSNCTFSRVSQSLTTKKVKDVLADAKLKYDTTIDTKKITAKLLVDHVGASNNSMATLVIANNTGHTIILDWAVYVNGYLCMVGGTTTVSPQLESNMEYKIPVYHGIVQYDSYGQNRGTVKSDMYLDNNSKARFTIEFNGVKYQGECDTSGNTSFAEIKN